MGKWFWEEVAATVAMRYAEQLKREASYEAI